MNKQQQQRADTRQPNNRQPNNRQPDDSQPQQPWHRLEPDQVFEELGTSRDGLSGDEAQRRLERHGPNRFGEQHKVSAWTVLLHQFSSPLIYVLLGALLVIMAIGWFSGDWRWADMLVIGAVLLINASVGFFQEYRAEHAVEALMKMVAPKAHVRRDGNSTDIEADQLVPGDVVEFDEGGVVPADVRLFEVASLQVNEAPLTGESVPVRKSEAALREADDELPPSERENQAFMGTSVTSGHAAGVVVATGAHTQIGQIAGQVEQAGQTKTPLQQRIERLARQITVAILLVAAVSFGIGIGMGRDWIQMMILAIALAVAAIPEGLPIVVTVALAVGVRRMAGKHAVIRRLPAVDTLGSCTTIVSDKTGTLTQNRMVVRSIFCADEVVELDDEELNLEQRPALREALRVAMLCNNAQIDEQAQQEDQAQSDHKAQPDNGPQQHGDPMELALLKAARAAGLVRTELEQAHRRIGEIPFQTERRFSATIHAGDDQDGPQVLLKGAPETVLDMCTERLAADGQTEPILREQIDARNEELAGAGLRVLAGATGRGEELVQAIEQGHTPGQLTFVGLYGLLDPPRQSAVEAIDDCHRAGIRVIMVTGDQIRTAAAIAREVHIGRRDGAEPASDKLPEAHSGRDINKLSDQQLDQLLECTDVFARIEPAQKHRLVERLKQANQIVAVTGDGVNDAPALKAAHIGAAMGSGTDVAKEASDMVITDDNFASVYSAVKEGRTAFRNIRMATFFLLSTGVAMVLLIVATLVLGWPLPLLPAQILWLNVVTNGIADVALAFEPGDRALYVERPRPPSEGVLNRLLVERLVLIGIWLALGTLAMFYWQWSFAGPSPDMGEEDHLARVRTATLTTMVLFQMVHVFNCRSESISIFKKSLLSNKVLLLGVLGSLAVHVAAMYMPWTQNLLSLAPLDLATWLLAAAIASTAILVNELHKLLCRRRKCG